MTGNERKAKPTVNEWVLDRGGEAMCRKLVTICIHVYQARGNKYTHKTI
jgi:hypothetical protein